MRVWMLAVFLLSCEKPRPAPPPAPEPYPLTVGAKWTYASEIGLKLTREVRPGPEPDWIELVYSLPLLEDKRLLMRRTAEGVVVRQGGVEQMVLRFPLVAGDKWRIDFPNEDLADCEVEAEEELEILGEKRRCTRLKVVRTARKSGKSLTDAEWYAPGLGLVRMRITHRGITQTFTLKSFQK